MEGGGQGEGGLIVVGCRLWVMTVCAPSADNMVILHGSAHHDAHHKNGYERIQQQSSVLVGHYRYSTVLTSKAKHCHAADMYEVETDRGFIVAYHIES